MSEENLDPRRIAVWVAMADHFLDTERRQDIPLTALRCLEAGLSIGAARSIWQYEVSPAVWFNVWNVAGEWAGWDRAWLVRSILQARRSWLNAPHPIGWMVYRRRVGFVHGVWLAIARCMSELSRIVGPQARAEAAHDLAALARHYLDSAPPRITGPAAARLRALYPAPFRTILAPALGSGEHSLGNRRVLEALREGR